MRTLSLDVLLHWILKELECRQSIFGIRRYHFFTPQPERSYGWSQLFGQHLATPIGPAAGPHTQLAQNIVSAWLCGGRFVELKTVQVLDELEIPRPCIDMEDEGYNVEWSQELTLDQSAQEYIKAWALIHILHHALGFAEKNAPGTIFNASVGYDLAGIRSAPMTRFLDRLQHAAADLVPLQAVLEKQWPQFAGIPIPSRITNNVTLSTMHGCPSGEIEQIARYLMEERGLHTIVKLNPTLLGKELVLHILHDCLGFHEIQLPDAIFEHDLQYSKAVELIHSLRQTASRCGLTFGVKLSNTLPAVNHKKMLPGDEMYMSGRALYPLTLQLFHKLAAEFRGELNVSFSGGADAFNVSEILTCGALSVTMATDLLKPGGYARIGQCLENIDTALSGRRVKSLDEWRRDGCLHLERAAAEALINPRYQKSYLTGDPPKVQSGLGFFDCITAPCMERCAVHQDVPEYAWWIAQRDYDRALLAIMSDNPLPGITGYICTQHCRHACTRSAGHYDQPIGIRALKRFAAAKGQIVLPARSGLAHRAAIIGAGPSGLAAAYFLALNGIRATVFEARDRAGGMVWLAPSFRIPAAIIQEDIDRIVGMGIDLRLSHPITRPPEELIREGFEAVYVASGFQKDAPLHLEGMHGSGVVAALDFLRRARTSRPAEVGPRVLVIGGGDTALDAARIARRLTGKPATVVYRRTREEMPAGDEDMRDAIEEGIVLEELASPARVVRSNGSVMALECVRNKMGAPEADGRRRPVPIEGSEFQIPADSIIVAVGQSPELTFLDGSSLRLRKDGTIAARPDRRLEDLCGIYAGGDAVEGPASVIAACADGRRAAEAICCDLGVSFRALTWPRAQFTDEELHRIRRSRARKEMPALPERMGTDQRGDFRLIEAALSEEAAHSEAARCLQCSVICDKCVEVCPNRANHACMVTPQRLAMPVLTCRNGALEVAGKTVFAVEQSTQIIHLPDLCNECGNCATFCVHQGKPHMDKPRVFMRLEDFARESDRAFYVEQNGASWIIRRREKGREAMLEMRWGEGDLRYEDSTLRAAFSPEDLRIRDMELKQSFPGELALIAPAEMYVIARGLISSLSFLIHQA
jgi:putative selenate reductase